MNERVRRANELFDRLLERQYVREECLVDEEQERTDEIAELRGLISLIPDKPKLDPVKGRPWD